MLSKLRNLLNKTPDYKAMEPPVIVGATGGSGTRVIQHILEEAGLFMGSDLNESRDTMIFAHFLDVEMNDVLRETHAVDYTLGALPDPLRKQKLSEFEKATQAFIATKPLHDKNWGWKNPRSILMLPFIHHLFPDMKFVHIVRDGRDIAFSANQNQPRLHFEALMGEPYEEMSPLHSIRMWERVNMGAAAWAGKHIPQQYYRFTYEELCEKPQETAQAMLNWLKIDLRADALASLVEPPAGLGKWKGQDKAILKQLEETGKEGLECFGYLSS